MVESQAHHLAAAQIDRYLRERALRHRPGEAKPSAPRPVITISRTHGIPAEEIAQRIGKALGFDVISREVLEAIARNTQLGDRLITSLDDGSRSTLDAWIAGWVDYDHPVVDLRNFIHMARRVIRGFSLHGSAIIIGHGANFILRGTDAFRVRLTAPAELRAAALVAAKNKQEGAPPLSLATARKEIAEHDARRKDFVQTVLRANIDDPEAYDIICNLRVIDADAAAGFITEAYRRLVEGK